MHHCRRYGGIGSASTQADRQALVCVFRSLPDSFSILFCPMADGCRHTHTHTNTHALTHEKGQAQYNKTAAPVEPITDWWWQRYQQQCIAPRGLSQRRPPSTRGPQQRVGVPFFSPTTAPAAVAAAATRTTTTSTVGTTIEKVKRPRRDYLYTYDLWSVDGYITAEPLRQPPSIPRCYRIALML